MTTITFDTLKFAKRFKKAGFTESQADAQTQALAEVLKDSGQGIATKLDITELKTEIQAMLNRQLQIMLAMMVALTGIFAALVKLL